VVELQARSGSTAMARLLALCFGLWSSIHRMPRFGCAKTDNAPRRQLTATMNWPRSSYASKPPSSASTAWAPRYVAEELRSTRLAADKAALAASGLTLKQ
jgi:hypothetical protein